jgi:FkbM family methyltransferase
MPIFGGLVHFLSYRILPANYWVWVQIQAGPAQGLWFELNPRTGGQYLRGEAEPVTQEVLASRLRPGMIVYDLGANIGLFSLLAARIVGPSGRVYSFEPDPETAVRLRRNIERNGFSNVTVVEAGAWSSTGYANFVPSDSSSPDRGLGRFEIDSNATGKSTRCVSLDDFVGEALPPQVIKCDVEGAELSVLRGAETILRAQRPWIICEMHSQLNAQRSRNFLRQCGYSLESLDDTHILALSSPTSTEG